MNRISEFIIRLLSPKPREGEILVMPYVAKSQKGISKRRNIPSDTGAAESAPDIPGVIPY